MRKGNAIPVLVLLLAIGAAFLFLFWISKTQNPKPVYLQKASGSWQINVQIPDCEFGHVIALPPERLGDGVTIYCNQMPVEGK